MIDIKSAVTELQDERHDRRRRPKIDWHYWPTAGQHPSVSSVPVQLDIPSRPEIEDEPLIAWGLAQSENESKCSKVTVDLLYGEEANLSMLKYDHGQCQLADYTTDWKIDIDNQDLERFIKVCSSTVCAL